MPALAVFIDGAPLVTVCCDGYDVVSVRLSGTRVERELATLDVSGGSYPDGGESIHLIWVSERPLEIGQRVSVAFLDVGATTERGKTIEELFPNDGPCESMDFTPTERMFEELRAKPALRNGYSFEYQPAAGGVYVGRTEPEEHGFGFTVLWNSHRPERASVSLNSYTIDSIQQRTPGHDHAREHIKFGQSVSVRIGA